MCKYILCLKRAKENKLYSSSTNFFISIEIFIVENMRLVNRDVFLYVNKVV